MVSVFTYHAGVTQHVRQDSFGRIVLDECESDLEHLQAPAVAGEERQKCRHLLEDEFRSLVGRKGALFLTAVFVDELTAENIDEVAPQMAALFREQAQRSCQELIDTNKEILAAIRTNQGQG